MLPYVFKYIAVLTIILLQTVFCFWRKLCMCSNLMFYFPVSGRETVHKVVLSPIKKQKKSNKSLQCVGTTVTLPLQQLLFLTFSASHSILWSHYNTCKWIPWKPCLNWKKKDAFVFTKLQEHWQGSDLLHVHNSIKRIMDATHDLCDC